MTYRAMLVLSLAILMVTPASAQESLYLEGRGQSVPDAFFLPAGDSVLTFTHNGSRNFAVWAYVGDQRELLVNTIGAYSGSRPLSASTPITLDITADGGWTVQVDPIPPGGTVAFSGTGDSVSGWFDSPGRATIDATHDGSRNFAVWAQCAGGRALVQNQIGAVNGSGVVNFSRGPCYWNVQADGNWSLTPR